MVVGIIGLGVGAGAWYRWISGQKAMNAERQELETKLSQMENRRRKAEKRVEELSQRTRHLERDLNIAKARREEKATAHAMWNLELARAERRWREVVFPGGDDAPDPKSAGEHLTYAIEQDVARLREEVGVSIRFVGAIDCDLDPESAVGSLRIAEEVLALATKNADEIVVTLDQQEAGERDATMHVTLDVSCEGWDEEVPVESDGLLTSVKTMAQRLGGWARYERPSPDVVKVSVQVPAGRPLAESQAAVDVDAKADEPVRS